MVSASARLAAGDTMAAGAWKAVEAKLMVFEISSPSRTSATGSVIY